MRTLVILTAFPFALATKSCIRPPIDKIKAGSPEIWLWQLPHNDPHTPDTHVEPDKCYGRVAADVYSTGHCLAKCQEWDAIAGITNSKIMCLNDPTKIATTNILVKMMQDFGLVGPETYLWTSLEKSGGVWSNTDCTTLTWPEGGENTNQLDWNGDGGATAVDSAVWVAGNTPLNWPGNASHGDTPFLTGITSGTESSPPNPDDIFCMCEYDYFDSATAVEPDPDEGKGSKKVQKQVENVVAAVAALSTGILVAAIVCPIVGLILLIICIVCICKHCCGNNKKPAA